jgi:hypothetical protein
MEIVALVEGLLMPYVVSYLAGSSWDRPIKTIFALLASAVVATATLAIAGELDWENLAVSATIVWATAQLKYNLWFSETELNETLLETPAGLKKG